MQGECWALALAVGMSCGVVLVVIVAALAARSDMAAEASENTRAVTPDSDP